MDRELVVQARSGDHAAFSSLAAAALARLFRTARLILRDDDLASDAVQEALLAAWLDIRGIRDPERFDAWLDPDPHPVLLPRSRPRSWARRPARRRCRRHR